MARKSRKQNAVSGAAASPAAPARVLSEETQARMLTAAYGRLSVENRDSDSSMEGQILLMRNYIDSNPELEYVDTYFDNGISGTTFNRPEFLRLMDDVRQKKIQCIVVKDLSRFGRNFLESCYYIEKIFPFLGVRLIAVTDNFDSTRKADMEGLTVPVTSLVNAMYAKDISKKVWTSMQWKKQNGFNGGGTAPFGYIRNPETMRFEIDSEAAVYVRLIFMWKLLGVSIKQIGKRLDLLGAPTPGMRLCQLGLRSKPLSLLWNSNTIRIILSNETYVGNTVTNKTNQALFAGQEQVKIPKAEWIITRNTHPAIIAQDDFDKVQAILEEGNEIWNRDRQNKAGQYDQYCNEMLGMVYCADCGAKMEFDRSPCCDTEGKMYCFYSCRRTGRQCRGQTIADNLLKVLVMDQIHLLIENLCDRDKLMQETGAAADGNGELAAANAKVLQVRAKVNEMADKRRKLYEDYVSGTVDMEDYQEIRNVYSREYDRLQEQLKTAEQEQEAVNERMKRFHDMASHLKTYLNRRAFDAELVKKLVERIEVGSDKRIRITFRFRDIFEPALSGMEGSEERKVDETA